MNVSEIKRYSDLWEMIKKGKAIINNEISPKLSDLKKIEKEFRLMGPSCGNVDSCGVCGNYKICWE